jgi:hypothetical protein
MADSKFRYPLRDSINNVVGFGDNPALDEDVSIFQQSFLGLSIVDFTCNLGFNTSASSLSLNLVQDDAFRFTPLVFDGVRNAITEGYHPWDTQAWPKHDRNGRGFYGKWSEVGDTENFPEVGSPVFFKYYDGKFLNLPCVSLPQDHKDYCKNVFAFNGLLSRWEKQYSSSGFTYSVTVTDPREILEGTTVILDGYAGRVSPADKQTIVDSERSLKNGWNGYYNILNVYGYYEVHGFGASKRTDQGMRWFDYQAPFASQYLDSKNEGNSHQVGILPALRMMLSGRSERYIDDHEPFGGPLWYGTDKRDVWGPNVQSKPPKYSQEIIYKDNEPEDGDYLHRYIVDLDDLINLSVNPEGEYGEDAAHPDSLLPYDFEIQGDRLSLLQLIQQVCDAAGCDFIVQLLDPRQADTSSKYNPRWWNDSGELSYDIYKKYSGVIKVIPLRKNKTFKKNIIRDTIDRSQLTPPRGPLVYKGSPILISGSVGNEFTDPIGGKVLYGAPRTRVVGVTPLGGTKVRWDTFFNDLSGMFFDTRSSFGHNIQGYKEAQDAKGLVLREGLPGIELDGVQLTNQTKPKMDDQKPSGALKSAFSDKDDLGFNPYGPESKDEVAEKQGGKPISSTDYTYDLPPVSNDDFLPWYLPKDFGDGKGKEIDPFQFNRVNSLTQRTSGTCDGQTCTKKFEKGTCINEDGDVASGYDTKTACEEDESNTWYEEGSLPSGPKKKKICTAIGGEMSDNENNQEQCEEGGNKFTPDMLNNSGYLDIYPCWGFQTITSRDTFTGDLLDDVVETSKKGLPIKGFFNDDDPYRDFHPQEGIFGVFEWVNPGLGNCFLNGSKVDIADEDLCECGPLADDNFWCESLDGTQGLDAQNQDDCIWQGGIWKLTTQAENSDCYKKWEATGNLNLDEPFEAKWISKCSAYGFCTTKEGKLLSGKNSIHSDRAGSGNDLHTFEWGCTRGCFAQKLDSSGNPIADSPDETQPIVAYFTKDASVSGGGSYTRGEIATSGGVANWSKWLEDGTIKLIESDEECTQSGQDVSSNNGGPEHRIAAPIKGTGELAQASDGNSFSSGDGLYGKECKAVSYRHPNKDACVVHSGTVTIAGYEFHEGTITPDKTAKACENRSGTVWIPDFGSGSFRDDYYAKDISAEENSKPGFVSTRMRVKGVCDVTSGEGDDKTTKQNWDLGSEYDCNTNGGEMRYIAKTEWEHSKGVGIPLIPRTATIPIDLSPIGYQGGPESLINAKDRNDYKGYYYATVTELRHAAVSKESWTQYLRELAGHLPCWMWKLGGTFNENGKEDNLSKWKDYCGPARPRRPRGGNSSASDYGIGFIAAAVNGEDIPPIPDTVSDTVGRKNGDAAKDFVGHSCGDDPTTPTMSIAAKTRMQVDTAYSIIKKVADNFYGRKYLVPLPFNPPTSVTCSNPRYKNKEDCVGRGFDWGSHGLLSSWYRKFGVGACFDMNGLPVTLFSDKINCELNRGIWIEPIQEKNRWEIVSAGWPGGSILFNKEIAENVGYPQNMNFWSDDGNLKSFALYPEKDLQRLSGASRPLSFVSVDPEQFDTEPYPPAPAPPIKNEGGESSSSGQNSNRPWGDKVFVSTEVDPRTYWLPIRPDWEIHHEKQYWKREAGDKTGGQGSSDGIDIFSKENENRTAVDGFGVKVGASAGSYDLTYNLNSRRVITREKEAFCLDENGQNTGAETEENCTDPNQGGIATNTWHEPDKKMLAAYKPYALITMPNKISYGEIDEGVLNDSFGGPKNKMCIPLSSSQGFGALMSAWLMGADARGAGVQMVVSLLNKQKLAANTAPDTNKAGFIAAAYKPWHAGIPQQSTHYKWGPWSVRNDYGKADVQIDESLHPSAFMGEDPLSYAALSRIRSAIVKSQREVETGSVTISSWGYTGWCGNKDQTMGFDAHTQEKCEEIQDAVWHRIGTNYHYATAGPGLGDQLFGDGPYVTDINVSIGGNGVNVTYNLSTQKKFGDTESIFENRQKKANNDILRARLESEKAISRTKRGIETWKKPPSE